MLRLLFVLAVIAAGLVYSVRGPFQMLLFYVWYAYFRPDAWVWQGEIIASLNLSLVLGALLLVSTLATRLTAFRLHAATLLTIAFLGHSAVGLFVSDYTGPAGWHSLEQFSKAAVISLLMPLLVDSQQRLRLLLLVMGLSLGFEGAKQGWVQLVTNPGAVNTNEVPFLGDNNHVAVGMLMLVSVLGALAATAPGRRERNLHRFLLVGVLYRALATYSRGGFLSALALGGVALVRSRYRLRVLLAMAVVASLVLPVMPPAFWERMASIKTPGQINRGEMSGTDGVVEDGSVQGRLHFWRVAREMAADHPFLGIGHGNYITAYDAYDFSGGRHGTRRAVHSAWFGVLGELGYVGLLLFVGVIASTFLAARRVRLATRGRDEYQVLYHAALAVETGMVVFCVGGTFVTMQYNEMLWHFVGLGLVLRSLYDRELAAAKAGAVAAPLAQAVPVGRSAPAARWSGAR